MTNKTEQIREYITDYDLRGGWTKQEYKDSIRKQINSKIANLFSEQRQDMLSTIKGLGCNPENDSLTVARILNELR